MSLQRSPADKTDRHRSVCGGFHLDVATDAAGLLSGAARTRASSPSPSVSQLPTPSPTRCPLMLLLLLLLLLAFLYSRSVFSDALPRFDGLQQRHGRCAANFIISCRRQRIFVDAALLLCLAACYNYVYHHECRRLVTFAFRRRV